MCISIYVYSHFAITSGAIGLRPSPHKANFDIVDIGLVFEMLGSFMGWSNLDFACLLSVFLLCANSIFGYIMYVKAAGLVDFFVGMMGLSRVFGLVD